MTIKKIYKPKGVCSRAITLELEDEVIKTVKFEGGCNGNSQGIAALAVGMNARDYIARCKEITCGPRSTSCPAQLAEALQECLNELKN